MNECKPLESGPARISPAANAVFNDGVWHVAVVSATSGNLTISVDGGAMGRTAWSGAELGWTDTALQALEVVVGCGGTNASVAAVTRFHGRG